MTKLKPLEARCMDLSVENDELRAEAARLRAALERVGSMEAMTLGRMIDQHRDAELLARIKFARAALASKEATT